MAVEELLTSGWRADQVEVMERLRDWADTSVELNQHTAAWMGLPTSDANALGHITWSAESGRPLSPAQLARRIGMTSGATSVLLRRLEQGGHITRVRSQTDLRRVSLHPTAQARERTRGFMAFAGAEISATVRAAEPDELRRVAAFLERMVEAGSAANERLAAVTASGRRGRS
jgi:MarR family transcriptional regulator, organic hydroperoxide resistance regulator